MDPATGISFIGKATLQDNGLWRCLANVAGTLCLVEIRITLADASSPGSGVLAPK